MKMKKLEIKYDDLIQNINTIKNICGNSKIIAVLKGNGYGLGITQFAEVLLENQIDFFAVSELDEAEILRGTGFNNEILLLSPTINKEEAEKIASLSITAAVGSVDSARVLSETGVKTKAHIKIDTGFGRFGFHINELDEAANQLKSFENIEYSGVFSHFSNSFGKKIESSKKQFDLFMSAVERLNSLGINPEIRHICNSCGALRFDFARLDAVRIGSAFLGRLPVENTFGLKRIAHLKCSISEIRTLPKGSNVGYADTYKTKRDTKIAIIPVGYKDGFGVEKSRDTFRFMDILRYIYGDVFSLGKKLYVGINGKNVPIIGRISMYNIIADVTDVDAKPGDTVILECNPILIDSSIKREYCK